METQTSSHPERQVLHERADPMGLHREVAIRRLYPVFGGHPPDGVGERHTAVVATDVLDHGVRVHQVVSGVEQAWGRLAGVGDVHPHPIRRRLGGRLLQVHEVDKPRLDRCPPPVFDRAAEIEDRHLPDRWEDV